MILLASWSKAQNDFSNDINNPQNPFDVTSSTPQSDTAFQNPNQNPLNRDYYGNNNNFGSNNNNFGGNSNFGGSNNFGNNDDYLASGRTSTPRPYDFGSSDYSNRNYNPRDPFNSNPSLGTANDPNRDNPYGNRNTFGGVNSNDDSRYYSNTGGSTSNRGNTDTFGRPITPIENTVNLGRGRTTLRTSFLDTVANNLFNDPTYFIVASRMVRPGQVYRVSVQVLLSPIPITVRASISRSGVEISGDTKEIKIGIPETMLMRVPPTSVPGDYKLRVEGVYSQALGGIAFINETRLTFSQRSMTIFVQTDKPVYMQGETVHFRAIPITTALRGFDNAIDLYMIDPHKHILRRWLSRQSNLGTVSLQYKLSDQPIYGDWTIRVVAQGQIEEHKFTVEEYYQTRFEVNVTMPAFFFNSDPYIHGKIMANFTSGFPVKGNLTIKAQVRPLGWFNSKVINQKYRVGNTGPRNLPDYNIDDQYLYNPNINFDYGQNYDPSKAVNQPNVPATFDQNYGAGQPPQSGYTFQDQYTHELYYNFDEEWPFWIKKPDTYRPTWGSSWSGEQHTYLPYLRYFNGTFNFQYPMSELLALMPNTQGMEVLITATVGERFYDEVIQGYAMARVYNSSIKVNFLGGSPQVFKPTMPYMLYLAAQYHDGSPLYFDEYYPEVMEVAGFVESRAGGRRELPLRTLRMSEKKGVWEMKLDVRNDLNLGDDAASRDFLLEVQQAHLTANFIDRRGEHVQADLLLVTHFSPQNHQIKIQTSTHDAKVGEYIVLHVQTNFFAESFNYVLMSKGIILLSGQEEMTEGIRTMAITLAAEMAPVSTFVVWHIGVRGTIVSDSLTFPVNGISRNNFTVYVNNRKARTGERVEVAVFGEPGAYVGLSGIDNAFYTMQAGNELTYANVITKMSTFDEQTNGTHKQTWYSHEGNPDQLVYYPSASFGIDANRTFEYAGLVIFTDGTVPRRHEFCNLTLGYAECLNGRCYSVNKRCDGYIDCEDATDESNCNYNNFTTIAEFRKYRFNRIKRHYENVWLWKDINIGPHGRFIFSIDVPEIPALWMVSAFSVSPSMGYGMINKAIEYVGVQPFFINVEMPTDCRQGEQVGIRVTVFNYQTTAIEATVVLHASPDYKFVHVEENGIVRSYNPVTSYGEQQFFIYLDAQGSTVVYLPIVPQRYGDIEVTVHGATLLGTDTITRVIHVEPDGVPQYRHQSILLDLSNRAYVLQYMHVNVTETPIITYDVDRYYVFGSNRARISVVGDVVGPIFPTMPVNATSLIYLPMDSAEQNMFSFAANLYTIMYMRLINQRNRTTEKNAFHHMNIGYQRQLSFMMPDGSFSLFRSDWNSSASSVWLTAYCARMFQDASFYEWENYLYIDPLVIQKAIRYVLRHQTPEGAFYEVTWSPDRKLNGTLNLEDDHIKYRNISLTAHVLITLVTVKDLSGVSVISFKFIQCCCSIRRLTPNFILLSTEFNWKSGECSSSGYKMVGPKLETNR